MPIYIPKPDKPEPKNVGWIKRAARIHQSAETIHWWKRCAFSALHQPDSNLLGKPHQCLIYDTFLSQIAMI
ncbi:MAG: hypothetical protein NUV75_07350, partial [Gallionella sp.]|nr:hypothetical protein [Gallionella sp.]